MNILRIDHEKVRVKTLHLYSAIGGNCSFHSAV